MFSVELSEKDESPLSSSAKKALSKSDKGKVKHDLMLTTYEENERVVLSANKVPAINRSEMKGIFDKIYAIIEKSKSMHIECPIAVKILTAGGYSEEHVKRLFDRFFGSNYSSLFKEGDFPVEFFNYYDLNAIALKKNPTGTKTRSGYIDLRKVSLLEDKFAGWEKVMHGLKKDRIVLIDNADYNTEAVKSKGFTAVHYPTTPSDFRDRDINFTQGKHEAISKITALIKEIEDSMEQFQKEEKDKRTIVP